ncbi:hypothetical protein WJX77_008978 [Trebouxia sp. C0004]
MLQKHEAELTGSKATAGQTAAVKIIKSKVFWRDLDILTPIAKPFNQVCQAMQGHESKLADAGRYLILLARTIKALGTAEPGYRVLGRNADGRDDFKVIGREAVEMLRARKRSQNEITIMLNRFKATTVDAMAETKSYLQLCPPENLAMYQPKQLRPTAAKATKKQRTLDEADAQPLDITETARYQAMNPACKVMEPAKLRQQILSSSKTASEKAEDLLLEREVNEMSKDEWRELIAGIPEDVKREIGRLKSAGQQELQHLLGTPLPPLNASESMKTKSQLDTPLPYHPATVEAWPDFSNRVASHIANLEGSSQSYSPIVLPVTKMSSRESAVVFTWHSVVTETMNRILKQDGSDLQWQPDHSDLPTDSTDAQRLARSQVESAHATFDRQQFLDVGLHRLVSTEHKPLAVIEHKRRSRLHELFASSLDIVQIWNLKQECSAAMQGNVLGGISKVTRYAAAYGIKYVALSNYEGTIFGMFHAPHQLLLSNMIRFNGMAPSILEGSSGRVFAARLQPGQSRLCTQESAFQQELLQTQQLFT